MAIDALSAAAAGPTSTGRASLAANYETFLALLTTQLKNQDPTAPLDTNTFTQQLVQMSGVEQQLLTNDLLKQLTEKGGDALSAAVGYIGRVVTVAKDEAVLTAGAAEWDYNLPRAATIATVEVLDAAGAVVRRETGATGAGAHAFAWDGRDQTGAQRANGGAYRLRVTATDALGAAITPDITTQGVVTAVEQSGGVATLIINGASAPLTAVRAVRQPS